MLIRNIFAFALLTACSTALADSLDVNLRDNSAQLQYGASLGRDSIGASEVHAGILYTSNSDRFVDFGLVVKETPGTSASGLTAGVALKGVMASVGNTDAAAVALGGQLHYLFPDAPRFALVGRIYFSPNITTYSDAERFTEAVARLEFEVIPQAVAYLGYRRISFSLINVPSASVLDSGLHLGAKMVF